MCGRPRNKTSVQVQPLKITFSKIPANALSFISASLVSLACWSYSDFRMTLKYGFGKCSLFVFSASGWKDQNMDSLFSRQRISSGEGIVRFANPVAVWRQSEVSFDFWKVLGHEVFSPKRSLNKPKATLVCTRSINQSNRSIAVRLLILFCSRVFIFKVMRKSLYLLTHCLWLSDRIVAYTFVQKKPFTYRKDFFNSVKHCCFFLLKLKELTSWQMIRNGIHVVCLHFVVKCSDVEGLGCVW